MIIKQVPMTPLGPSGLPHDLERFRPVEREEVKDCYIEILFTNSKYSRAPCNAINVLLQVQVVASPRIEMPVMLRASPMDRAGLHTWLATRKAEADKKREEEVGFIFSLYLSAPHCHQHRWLLPATHGYQRATSLLRLRRRKRKWER